jgi:hypothetical protein
MMKESIKLTEFFDIFYSVLEIATMEKERLKEMIKEEQESLRPDQSEIDSIWSMVRYEDGRIGVCTYALEKAKEIGLCT